MAKRIKTEVEKQLIVNMWNALKEYNMHKAEFEDVCGSYIDGELMRKAKNKYNKLCKALQTERMSKLRNVG